MKIFLLTYISIIYLAVGQNECLPATCGPYAPVVRFPFWLKGRQPEHCGYPGFGLSCNESGRADLDLQFPVTASPGKVMLSLNMTVAVWNIDYKAQKMLVNYVRTRSCLPEKLPTVNSSAPSIFDAEAIGYGGGTTLFNCSNTRNYETVGCLSNRRHQVLQFASMYDISSLLPYSSCFKMYNISYVPDRALTGGDDESGSRFYLKWIRPSCGKCEAKGDFCRLQNSSASAAQETECFTPQHGTAGASTNHKPLAAGITAGIIVVVFSVIALFFVFKVMRRKRNDYKRIENAIKGHKDMRARRYTYAEVKRIRKNLKAKPGALHKGKLDDGTPVGVKVVDASEQDEDEFITEVEIISRMQHANILPLMGYCIDGRKRALIYELVEGATLVEQQQQTLGWEKIEQIGVGIAKGVEHVHQESPKKILNVLWNPGSILLDRSFNPKIIVSSAGDEGASSQYTAPELLASSVNMIPEKAYAYGFGMLLLDMVGSGGGGERREVVHSLFPEWVYREVEKREENEDSVKKMMIVGLWCIQWFPSDRPSIKGLIQMLQQQNMPLPAMPPNPFHLKTLN